METIIGRRGKNPSAHWKAVTVPGYVLYSISVNLYKHPKVKVFELEKKDLWTIVFSYISKPSQAALGTRTLFT